MSAPPPHPAPPPADRITEAYLGGMGEGMMQATRARIDWICGQVRGPRVLDIGCSQGIAAILLARAGFAVTAVDVDPRVLLAAREHLAAEPAEVRGRVDLLEIDVAALPPAEPFDSVILGEILEHLEDPTRMIAIAAAHLRPGGRLVATVPFGINDFPDHRQTFYLAGPYGLIAESFDVGAVEMFGRWIGFAATKPPAAPRRRPPPPELLPRLEAEFLALEQRLRADSARARRQLRALQQAARPAAPPAPDPRAAAEAQARAEAQRAQTEALHARLAAQARALAAAEAAQAQATAELAALRASTTHRIALQLVRAAGSPRAALGLPLALARLWRASCRARQGAAKAGALAREARALERNSSELTLESCLLRGGGRAALAPDGSPKI